MHLITRYYRLIVDIHVLIQGFSTNVSANVRVQLFILTRTTAVYFGVNYC